MRFFHMADLHIGKKLNQASFLEDQTDLLHKVLALMDERQPDALLLAGDIYDRRNPAIEAVQLLDWFLAEVVLTRKTPVLVIGGNHDGGERLGFAGGILAKAGLHIAGELTYPMQEVVLQDEAGEVCVHLLPYADLARLKHIMRRPDYTNYQVAMADVLAQQDWLKNDGRRHVLMAHGVVIGADPLERSESERELAIGGSEYWESALLQDFDYVALGHLHRMQRAGAEHIRYAGSMLAYSFSEAGQEKGLLEIDLDATGLIKITPWILPPLRQVRTVTGTLAEVMTQDLAPKERDDDYLRVLLTDPGELLEPMAQLRTRYPNVLVLERTSLPQAMAQEDGFFQDLTEDMSPLALFEAFYQHLTAEPLSLDGQAALTDILQRAKEVE